MNAKIPLNISIVIAAKNEEKNLPKLFPALEKLNYPKENFEMIFVNDQSTDNTKKIIDGFIERNQNAKAYDSSGKTLPGKKGALDIGIKNAANDFIMITDADCESNPSWLLRFSEKFNEGHDFLFGIAPYKQEQNFVNKIACFENLRSHILTFTAAKFNLPYSAAARSFGFKKSSFQKLEGYHKTLDTLCGDDDLLLREAVKHKMNIGTITEPDAFVYSETKNTFKDYIKQKARHTSTSNYYLLKHKLFLSVWHLLNLVFLFSPLLMFFNPLFVFLFLFKIGTDILMVKSLQHKFGYKFSVPETIVLQIIYELLLIINYLNGTFSSAKRKW